MATTYYFPYNDGAAEYDPAATQAGSATFQGNLAQGTAGSYTVITANAGTDPQTYTVTLNYTGPGTGTTITTVATPYSNADHIETYYDSPQGPVLFILTNEAVAPNYAYTFTGASSPFVSTAGSTTDPTVCFASGTLIRTQRGDVAVEALRVGDVAVNAGGAPRPIKWLGSRTVDCRRHPRPSEVLPVRITANAFGPAMPSRALYLSPGHSICVDMMGEALIPAISLVNGTSIVQVEVETVTYWHVELDSHDILVAENLACESYLEMGNRGFFADVTAVLLHATPDGQVKTHAEFCRPFVAGGPLLDAVKMQLNRRAARHAAAARDKVAAVA